MAVLRAVVQTVRDRNRTMQPGRAVEDTSVPSVNDGCGGRGFE